MPIRKSIAVGCSALAVALCLVLGVASYHAYRATILERYQAYETDLLTLVKSYIDVDDLARCLETGQKSEKYHELQRRMDQVKDSCNISFLYVVKPLNTSDHDNMQNVIAAMSADEWENLPEVQVTLGGLTGDSYSSEAARKYCDAMAAHKSFAFFVDATEWGVDYTGVTPLTDSSGKDVGLLCVDIDVTDMQREVAGYVVTIILLIVVVSLGFTALFMRWANRTIAAPIKLLEERVAEFAYAQKEADGKSLSPIIDPEIHTRNEVESLSRAVVRMSEDTVEYVRRIVDAEERARLMGELAHRDALTKVRNRSSYDAHMQELESEIAHGTAAFALVVADLDNLKGVNDRWGHERGNEYIIASCKVICDVYSHSPVFRIGGDEFVVLLRGKDYEQRDTLLDEVTSAFRRSREDDSAKPWMRLSASVGMAVFDPAANQRVEDVFVRADKTMYESKAKAKRTARATEGDGREGDR